ncbi:MAG: MATE family efflux transporter [Acutalibacteraceae bacterium]
MINLSDNFNYGKLLRFTFPSIIMLVFSSVYGVVDGYFVSNYAGKTSFAAVNFIMPVLMILGCIGFMFGTGGGALIAKTLGEKDDKKANEIFTMIVAVSVGIGVILTVLGIALMPLISRLLGADGKMLDDSVLYGRIVTIGLPFYILQYEFQCLFATAGKPKLGLYVTAAAGVTNMVLDYLLVAVFPLGIIGAAAATAFSQLVGGVIPLIYFLRKNSSLLRFTKFKFDGRALFKTCTNGSSEFLSNIAMSVVSMLYNRQLMRYAGEDGVSAYGVLMYVGMIFMAVFVGYSVGVAPIVGYNYGAQNKEQLKNILRKSTVVIFVTAVVMFAASEFLSAPLSRIYVGYDQNLLEITVDAFKIFSFAFLFSGFAIFGSSFFTALNDGLTSALISFFRTLVFQAASVLIFPLIWDLDGIWISIVAADVMAVALTLVFVFAKRKKYGYL